MKILSCILLLAAFALAEDPAPRHKMTRDEAAAALQAKTKEQLITEMLDRAFPPSLVGKTLPASVKGSRKYTVAAFMASTCPHCVKEVPYLRGLDETAKKGTTVSVVPVFFSEDKGWHEFMSAQNWGAAPVTVTGEDVKAFPIRGTPTIVIADSAGKILSSFVGELDEAERTEIAKLFVQE